MTSGALSVPVDVGTGTLVLFIHGQPGTGQEWRPLAESLQSDHRVIAPDRPGWGSHPRPPTTLAGNAAVLSRMLAERGVSAETGDRVVVVGHSLGGGIALELALTRPDLVGALVLIGSVGVAGAVTGMDRLLAVPVLGDGVLRAGGVAMRRAARTAIRLSQGSRPESIVGRAHRFPAVRSLIAEGDRQMDGRDRRSFLVEQRALIDETPLIERRLPSLRKPCIVMHGSADRIVAPQAARDLAAAIPGAELLFVGNAGHRLPFEQPALVAATVRRYSRLMGLGSDGS
ncbi:MAG: alpha/beta fold hydrolase [Acidimicrobiales bacterium]